MLAEASVAEASGLEASVQAASVAVPKQSEAAVGEVEAVATPGLTFVCGTSCLVWEECPQSFSRYFRREFRRNPSVSEQRETV